MQIRRMRFWIMCIAMNTVPTLGLSAAGQSGLNGQQALDRCRRAYDSLKSYQGLTRVSVKSTMGGMPTAYNTQANVRFLRPGRLRMDGTLMTSGKFACVSNGRGVWFSWSVGGGKWQKAQNAEMAVASLTGISMNAATTIPAILLNLHWGNPFAAMRVDPKVGQETVGGRRAYRVQAATPTGPMTFWIDPQTWLLLKMTQRVSLSGLKMPGMGGRATQGTMDYVQTYSNVKINAALAASEFARPAGAPP